MNKTLSEKKHFTNIKILFAMIAR